VPSWRTCGDHSCREADFEKFESATLLNMVFVRNPISRFESLYNFVPSVSVPARYRTAATNASVSAQEMNFKQFVRFYHDYVFGEGGGWGGYNRMHFQPTSHGPCVRTGGGAKCFRPDFVGHTETLLEDATFLMSKVPTLAATWDGTLSKENVGRRERIPKGTIFKHREELLMLCKVYWNDFQCGHYQRDIPRECQEENAREWHLPPFCIDLNNEPVQWPDHRE